MLVPTATPTRRPGRRFTSAALYRTSTPVLTRTTLVQLALCGILVLAQRLCPSVCRPRASCNLPSATNRRPDEMCDEIITSFVSEAPLSPDERGTECAISQCWSLFPFCKPSRTSAHTPWTNRFLPGLTLPICTGRGDSCCNCNPRCCRSVCTCGFDKDDERFPTSQENRVGGGVGEPAVTAQTTSSPTYERSTMTTPTGPTTGV